MVVNRRIAHDTYLCFNATELSTCKDDDDNTTYLVSERRCVKDQELFGGKIQTDQILERGVVDARPPFCKHYQLE